MECIEDIDEGDDQFQRTRENNNRNSGTRAAADDDDGMFTQESNNVFDRIRERVNNPEFMLTKKQKREVEMKRKQEKREQSASDRNGSRVHDKVLKLAEINLQLKRRRRTTGLKMSDLFSTSAGILNGPDGQGERQVDANGPVLTADEKYQNILKKSIELDSNLAFDNILTLLATPQEKRKAISLLLQRIDEICEFRSHLFSERKIEILKELRSTVERFDPHQDKLANNRRRNNRQQRGKENFKGIRGDSDNINFDKVRTKMGPMERVVRMARLNERIHKCLKWPEMRLSDKLIFLSTSNAIC